MSMSRDRTGLSPDKLPNWFEDPVRVPEGSIPVTAKVSPLDGGIVFSKVGQDAVRNVVTDTSPKFTDEVIVLSVSGCATALPCTLKRVRCTKVTGAPVQLTIYDDNNQTTGRIIWQGTLAQDADAADIPDAGLPAMTGLYCKWTGAAGDFNFHITVGAAQ